MNGHRIPDRLAAVAALHDPSRRAVYDHVLRAPGPVGRDDVAAALDMVRGTAAFHLDRLAREGLLTVSYRRLGGRTGPGSGRPAKLYAPAVAEVSVSLPERHYDLAADILAAAVEESMGTGRPVGECLQQAASAAGAAAGSGAPDLEESLVRHGFEPQHEADGSLTLANCPFHQLARNHQETVCGLNLGFLAAAAAQAEGPRYMAVADPGPDRCCVRLRPAGSSEQREGAAR
ncbi:helix-turn-helix transcriptional regulator [Arthrobacter mobilis]|uniref:Transcriptional regulator n=1 Tax=Arthrobacter mobilis TaxID=2724944 RepID=A0A7X6HBE7_9MICC|nr:transcriptional regulator [Arthrobacter mobilis]NKX53996.1 transcriptional regulator [Arthrobacter mobilis]